MAGLQTLLAHDVTAASAIAFTAVTGVQTSATGVHVWLDKGTVGSEAHGIRCYPRVKPTGSSTWLTSGHPAVDEGWFKVAITGGTGPTSEKRFVPPAGGAYRIVKASKPLKIGDLYGNCAVYMNVTVQMPEDAEAIDFDWEMYVTNDVVTQATDPYLPCGLLRGLGDTSVWEWVNAPVITATGTPDSHVHGSFHSSVWYGVFSSRAVLDDLTLNQTDGSAGTLTPGQAYKALISRSSDFSTALTVTKGTRASSSSATVPALPAGEKPVAVVHVAYGAGGSVINASNITNLGVDGWGHVTAGTGLQALVGTFRAQLPGSFVEIDRQSTVALTASSTNRIWANTDGTFSVVTASDTPPFLGSEWFATATTDGSGITALVDKRRFEDSAGEWIELKKLGSETAATGKDSTMVPYPHQVAAVVAAVGVPSSGGATGNSRWDVNRRRAGTATTIFTNQGGSTETRPTVAAGGSTDTAAVPELVSDGNAGDSYVLDQDAATTGGTQATDVYVRLLVYRRP